MSDTVHQCQDLPRAPLCFDGPCILYAGGGDTEQGRPSSSGGRLEQHLGAVESVDIPSPASTLVPSAPVASRIAVAPAALSRNIRGVPIEGSGRGTGGGGKFSGAAQPDGLRAFKGGSSNGASFGSSGSRVIAEDQYTLNTRKPSDAGQQSVGGRRVGDRKGGGRRRSADFVPVLAVGAESNSNSLTRGPGAGRKKADGGKTRPRRAAPQVSFGSSMTDGGSGGDRGGGGGRRARERGGEARDKAGRGETGPQDNKFRMQAGQSNTLVAVRLRPLLKHDREQVEVAKVCTKYAQRSDGLNRWWSGGKTLVSPFKPF